jgi:hypothetical protein
MTAPESGRPHCEEITMTALRRAACVLLAAASLLASPAYATSFTTDSSDLWYIQAESGWGIQLVQRGSVIFGTMFVYDPTGAPTWYVATMQSVGNLVWTGDLYATTGPWFGTVPFNPANVTARKAGTMTWTLQTIKSGILTYVVDGVLVIKNVTRQTLVFDNFSGFYLGAIHLAITGCFNPAQNGTGETLGTFSMTQNGQTSSFTFIAASGVNFTIAGTAFFQDGQFGAASGTYTSSVGEVGNAGLFEMNVQYNALTSRLSLNSTNNGCQSTGYLGGIRSRP